MRAFQWVANQFLVEGLANNRTFQRFALKIHDNVSTRAPTHLS